MATLDKTYQPADFEAEIYQRWQAAGAFRPAGTGQPFVITLPPPNANADLHCGHALDFQVKDVLARWQRLAGRAVLMVPGADHAGFETWSVYEQHLVGQGRSRFDFGRKELYDQVAAFVDANKGNMTDQIRRLGTSCDWDRFVYSLDDKVIAAARETFRKMWQEGLIYRGQRLVNYCPAHATSFADIEVDYQEQDGQLWSIDYPLAEGDRKITVATTRPETLLGDTAVAVHPDDGRWRDLVGQSVRLPISRRLVPIVADPAADPDLGSGAVKVTPGHDFIDAEIGQRQQLEVIDLLDDRDRLRDYDWLPPKYHGQTLAEARRLVLADLEDAGQLAGAADHRHRVGRCYKCNTPLEPLRRPQWFVRMKPLTDRAIAALEGGEIKFYPDRKRRELIDYLRQLRDWNISRQIVWGIPIPVAQNTANPDDWVFDDRDERDEFSRDGSTYRPDPDVFDTWWSSGHWPWVSLDWPDQPDGYYPTSLMETGQDILKPWVSRMICLGLYATDQTPFRAVALHGMVVDSRGVKMSKSKGNVVNPMETIDEFGADALRLALMTGLSLGADQPFDQPKIKAGKHFCNKLWNIGRYLQTSLGDQLGQTVPATSQTGADDWIWHQFNQTRAAVADQLDNYRFGEALARVWQFVWHQLADWYIESAKWQANPAALALVWRQTLRLVHPWAPFVSEQLWQTTVAQNPDELLISQRWETMPEPQPDRVADFDRLVEATGRLRSLLAKLDRPDGRLSLLAASRLAPYQALLAQLTGRPVELVKAKPAEAGNWPVETGRASQIWLDLEPDTRTVLVRRLTDEQKQLEAELGRLQARLDNPDYQHQAPARIVAASREQLKATERKLADVADWLKQDAG